MKLRIKRIAESAMLKTAAKMWSSILLPPVLVNKRLQRRNFFIAELFARGKGRDEFQQRAAEGLVDECLALHGGISAETVPPSF